MKAWNSTSQSDQRTEGERCWGGCERRARGLWPWDVRYLRYLRYSVSPQQIEHSGRSAGRASWPETRMAGSNDWTAQGGSESRALGPFSPPQVPAGFNANASHMLAPPRPRAPSVATVYIVYYSLRSGHEANQTKWREQHREVPVRSHPGIPQRVSVLRNWSKLAPDACSNNPVQF
jgi:hypothetical protein